MAQENDDKKTFQQGSLNDSQVLVCTGVFSRRLQTQQIGYGYVVWWQDQNTARTDGVKRN